MLSYCLKCKKINNNNNNNKKKNTESIDPKISAKVKQVMVKQ